MMERPRVFPEGPSKARILIVGDYPSLEDLRKRGVFQDYPGREFTELLHQVGLIRTDCRLTYLSPFGPPAENTDNFFPKSKDPSLPFIRDRHVSKEIAFGLEELRQEVAKVQPEIIIALGEGALWALTGEKSITKWRGSCLKLNPSWSGPYDPSIDVIPSLSPRDVVRVWEWRSLLQADLSRCKNSIPSEPAWAFSIPTTFAEARKVLSDLLLRTGSSDSLPISCDIETVERHYIDCIGFGLSRSEAICIPLVKASDLSPLYSPEEEADLIRLIQKILTSAKLIGQNFFYDAQYIARFWGVLAVPVFDTMIAHAVCYPGTKKSLDYLSSIYLPWHRYWKDELKSSARSADDLQRWEYNCLDCCSTWALHQPIQEGIERLGLQAPLAHEMDLFRPLLNMMLRGVRQDKNLRSSYFSLLLEQQQEREEFFESITAEALSDIQLTKGKAKTPWYRSSPQQIKLFYDFLRLPVQKHKKTKRPSVDDDALAKLQETEPVFKPLLQPLAEYRSLGVFLSTYVLTNLDKDGRIRCSYNPVGTETFRFNSSSDVFGYGGNLQNIPAGNMK